MTRWLYAACALTLTLPGKDTPACDLHTDKLISVGRFLGIFVSATPVAEEKDCTNCANEAKKASEKP